MAKAEGVSINQFLATVIAERVGELKALSHVRARIARADLAKAREVLALVPIERRWRPTSSRRDGLSTTVRQDDC